jgi:hypothetical protein
MRISRYSSSAARGYESNGMTPFIPGGPTMLRPVLRDCALSITRSPAWAMSKLAASMAAPQLMLGRGVSAFSAQSRPLSGESHTRARDTSSAGKGSARCRGTGKRYVG